MQAALRTNMCSRPERADRLPRQHPVRNMCSPHLVTKGRVRSAAGLRPVAEPLLGQQVQQPPGGAGARSGVQLAARQAIHVRREASQDVPVSISLAESTGGHSFLCSIAGSMSNNTAAQQAPHNS